MVEHVSIEEASRRLGVSQSAIRRRLRAGRLQGERRETPQGHQWLIAVPDAPDPSIEQAAPSRAVDELVGQLAIAKEAIARLEAHNTDLRTANSRLETELDARREEVGRLIVVVREAQRALPLPTLDRTEAVDAPSASPTRPVDADQAPRTRPVDGAPWWRRAWSRLSGAQPIG